MKTAQGKDRTINTTTWNYDEIPRKQEQFGYAYDKAWNLNYRTNNALTQTFNVDTKNQLTTATRSGTLTVAGLATGPKGDPIYGPAGVTNVVVSGTGLSSGNADLYADGSWARAGATLANGNNTYTATAKDTYDRTATDSVTLNLPATTTFQYDGNGNLTSDGRRVFEYDYENQLTNVYVASAWKSEFRYDAFGRKRIQRDYGWQSSAWTLTNEIRYIYDGMLVIQERHADNPLSVAPYQPVITYTRGADLSGSLQGAGGIGGLLARTENVKLLTPGSALNAHAYYHADGNGNITAMVNTNGIVVARYNYDPYGNMLGMSGPLAEANTYRFSSKEWNGNAGLYYYGFRFYEPNVQRWLNRDPIGMKGGVNLYGFIRNMVGIFVDALGLKMYPCDFVGPLQQGDTRGMTQGQKEALTKLLDREKKSGTKAAAKQSSVTFGDGLLEPFNSSYNPDLPINTGSLNGEFDLDWFTDINSFTHGGAAPYIAPGLYTGAKSLWHGLQWFNDVDVGWPYQQDGERNAIEATVQGLKYSDIFNDEWMKKYDCK